MGTMRQLYERFYDRTCDLVVYVGTKDPVTKQTNFAEKTILTGQPCRLDYNGSPAVEITEYGIAKQQQSITLYLSPDITVASGAKIVVTKKGVSTAYKRSGVPAVYDSHQEINLELFTGWS